MEIVLLIMLATSYVVIRFYPRQTWDGNSLRIIAVVRCGLRTPLQGRGVLFIYLNYFRVLNHYDVLTKSLIFAILSGKVSSL